MNIWIEKTKVKGRKDRLMGERAFGNAIWSPTTGSDGRDTYKNMRKIKNGDVIIHFIDNNKFAGISKISSELQNVKGINGTDWSGDCYLFKLFGFESFDLDRNNFLNDSNRIALYDIANKSEVFYQSNLNLRQGAYLTPCSTELFLLINKIYFQINQVYVPYYHEIISKISPIDSTQQIDKSFNANSFVSSCSESGLFFKEILIHRFLSSMLSKPFVILTGLSGSGKTKMAQAFVKWICQNESQYRIVPVGADWTNREPLLGYPNALNPKEYVKPDSGVLDLIIQANNKPELPNFLILDEMNLSHVERYFADFLSVMESKDEISLYTEGSIQNGVPFKLKVPSNLFIIGTVNIDETTNMFSPKVLDRANTIEFRVTKDEMTEFLADVKPINLDALTSRGSGMAKSFLDMAANRNFATDEKVNDALVKFFGELKKTGAEFGYRSASEMLRLIQQLSILNSNMSIEQKIDIAIIQKLLPKLHGSRRKLCPILETLGSFCITGDVKIVKDVFDEAEFDFNGTSVLYPLSLEKISRMYRGAIDNGFASFAEA
jgi:5-methylcytosine-specific restriction protein B